MITISCLCPTFNRPPSRLRLLEEAVESFARQRVPDGCRAELVILNDAPRQFLECDQVGVRVINLPVRVPTLGDKYNLLVELARGDILLPWEDDDISLPLRLTQAVEMLRQDYVGEQDDAEIRKVKYWKPPQVWFLDGRSLHWRHNVGVRHHAGAFTREAWRRAGGYPAISGAQDAAFDALLGGDKLLKFPAGIPPAEWQYVYRWGVSDHHLSGYSHTDAAYGRIGELPVAGGVFRVEPKWHQDYEAMVAQQLAAINSAMSPPPPA